MDNTLKTISKTDDEIRVGNHMVLWGGRDLTGEYFTPETEFDSPFTQKNAVPVDWEHGLDDDPEAPQRDDVLGWVDWSTAKHTEHGLWVERVLSRRNQYMQYLETLIEEGMIGTSSEATRAAKRTKDGQITRWPIKRDALTVQPAEPRMMTQNALSALKSLAEVNPNLKALLQEAGEASTQGDGTGAEAATTIKPHSRPRGATMSEKTFTASEWAEITELLKAGKDALPEDRAQIPDALKTHEDRLAGIEKSIGTFTEVLEQLKRSPAAKDAGYIAPDSEEDHPETKSFADFLYAVQVGNHARLKSVYKAALAEGVGTTGGYAVPVQLEGPIVSRINELSVLRRAGARSFPMQSNELELFIPDYETAPSAGNTSQAGGAIAYWTGEAGAITESEPALKQVRLVAHKLAGYALASSEVSRDAVMSIENWLASSFAEAIAAQENYQFFRGNGVNKPQGVLESGALKSQSRSAASAVALADIANLMAGMLPASYDSGAFFCSPGALVKVIQLVSDPVSWLTSARDRMPMQLLGRPFFITGSLPGLNTAGDILHMDTSWYAIGDRGALEVAYSEHFKFQNDQGAWRVTKRLDGRPLVDSTITLEDGSTTVSPFVVLAAG